MSEQRDREIGRFWSLELAQAAIVSSCDKYRALGALATSSQGSGIEGPPVEAMRAISRQWPAALREAELVSPARIEDRQRRCSALMDTGPVALDYASLAAAGHADWLLWIELHQRLRDLSEMRRALAGEALRFDYAGARLGLSDTVRARWPDPARWPQLRGGVRLAYLALAWVSGLGLARLNFILFEREGHWDHKAGDPDWAHRAGPSEGRPGLRGELG